MRKCDRGFGEVRDLTQSPLLLSLSYLTRLTSGHFLTYSLYLKHTNLYEIWNMKYTMRTLILKSFEHAKALMKYLPPSCLIPANIPRLQFLR